MPVPVPPQVATALPSSPSRPRFAGPIALPIEQQRVQHSVFECEVDPAQWAVFRARLLEEIDISADSLRFYHLGANGRRRVEHVGAKPVLDLEGPIVV